MEYLKAGRVWIVLVILFIGSCAALPVLEPAAKVSKPDRSNLAAYFKAPELPERYYTPPRLTKKKSKRKTVSARDKEYLPLFLNPVLGASRQSIISLYGDARDGGKRRHEGIDIVAPRGTLIVAPSDGVITSVGYNSLGGKVIWMNDAKRKHSYYFAHLDSQMVTAGMIIKQGDTLGTVGNTGNAKRTRAHLHFGIYQKDSKKSVTCIRSRDQLVSMSAVSTAASE
jgi:murein DD-endopeptidase MepM/ murein hydrolase activator NlpD